MIDGSPYTVVEFQFVKPGKGAAFTRTKMKNLLTGAVLERNLRSGEKLEPADVENKTMQYLYADADSFVFMDTTTYDQVQIPRETVGESGELHAREHQRRGAVLQWARRGRLAAELHRAEDDRGRPGFPRRHRHRRDQARQDLDRREHQRSRFSSTWATSSRSTRAPASTSSASTAPSAPGRQPRDGTRDDRGRARQRSKRAPASCAPFGAGSRTRGSWRWRRRPGCARPVRRCTSTRFRPGRATGS